MKDERKTKAQLLQELTALRQQLAESHTAGERHGQGEVADKRDGEYFHLLMENVKDYAIFLLDPVGRVTQWNVGAERILGYPENEILGQSGGRIFTPEDRAQGIPEQEMRQAATAGRAEDERWHMRKDGTRFWGSGIMTALRDEQHQLRGFAKILRDLTERKQAEAELQQFAHVVSHDLREPLRTVGSYVQLLAQRYHDRLDAEAQEFIGYVMAGATRMQQMIEALLTYTRVGAQGKEFVPTDSEAVLTNVLTDLQVVVIESGATVTHEPLPTVLANSSLLALVFQNLVSNGMKFHGEASPRIHIAARREGPEWVFEVCDHGIGIDPRQAERIFQVFQRLHTQSQYPGTGVGLAICKKIIEQYGGRIWVKSEPGKGATFFFTLPAE
jgi:PAS domain S-box-containing protein